MIKIFGNNLAAAVVLVLGLINPTLSAIAQSPTINKDEIPSGQRYLADTYKDWQRLCMKSDQAEDVCHIYQLIKNQDNLPLGEITVFKATEPEGISAVATILTPLGTLLTSQLILTLDDDTKGEYPYSWCDKGGCYVRIALTDDQVYSMKKGRSGTIQIESISAPGEPIILPISFLGLTAAIGDLR